MKWSGPVLSSIFLALAATPAFSQQGPRGGPRLDEVKDALSASEEQWTLLQPRIRRIQELRHDVSGAGGGMMGGPGGPPPGGGFGPGGTGHHGPPGGPGPDDDASPDGPAPKAPPTHASATTRPAHAPPPGGFKEHRPHDDQHPDEYGPGPGGPYRSDVQDKLDDLSDALDTNSKPDEIKAKIEALHQARAKARAELDKSQDELRGMLDARQQAVLITMGVLD